MPTERKIQMENDPKQREDHEKDNPGLSTVIERNIRTIIQLRLKADSERSLQDRIANPGGDYHATKRFHRS